MRAVDQYHPLSYGRQAVRLAYLKIERVKAASGLLTLCPVAAGEFGARHMQVYLLHRNLQPAERAVQAGHQQTLGRSVLAGRCLVQNRQAEGVSPAEGRDPRHLSLHMTVGS